MQMWHESEQMQTLLTQASLVVELPSESGLLGFPIEGWLVGVTEFLLAKNSN